VSNGGMIIVNYEFEMMYEEVIVPLFKELFQQFPVETEENHE
jgi:hypothetical protein